MNQGQKRNLNDKINVLRSDSINFTKQNVYTRIDKVRNVVINEFTNMKKSYVFQFKLMIKQSIKIYQSVVNLHNFQLFLSRINYVDIGFVTLRATTKRGKTILGP